MRSWVRISAWLCLSLMFWTAAVESTHNHPSQTETLSCSICVVAHTASPAVATGHSMPVFAAVGVFHDEDVVAKALLAFSDRGIRGPPQAV